MDPDFETPDPDESGTCSAGPDLGLQCSIFGEEPLPVCDSSGGAGGVGGAGSESEGCILR